MYIKEHQTSICKRLVEGRGKCCGSKSYYKKGKKKEKKAKQFKADLLSGTKYRQLPRITTLEIMNKLHKLFIYDYTAWKKSDML